MVHFDPDKHLYTVDGVTVPSVTEITRFCAYDYKSMQPWLADAAARRGTAVHEACALIDYGEKAEETPESSGYLTAYRRFLKDYRPDWQLIEYPLGDLSLGFAGTPDRYGTIGGKPALLDIKTGQLHNVALRAQLTGYNCLLPPRLDDPHIFLALKLSKDGTYDLKEIRIDYELWNACMYLHKATERKKRT